MQVRKLSYLAIDRLGELLEMCIRDRPKSEKRGGNPIRTSPPKKETAPERTEAEIIKDLTETEVQSNEPS